MSKQHAVLDKNLPQKNTLRCLMGLDFFDTYILALLEVQTLVLHIPMVVMNFQNVGIGMNPTNMHAEEDDSSHHYHQGLHLH